MIKKLLFIMGIMALAFAAGTQAAVNDALVYWSFDDGTVTGNIASDSSNNNLNLQINNATVGSTGQFGDGIFFNGTDDWANFTGILTTNNTWGLSFWANVSDPTGFMLDCENGRAILDIGSNAFAHRYYNGFGYTSFANPFQNDTWHHHVYTNDGNYIYNFVDGVGVELIIPVPIGKNMSGRCSIGERFDGLDSNLRWSGYLDEFSIYDHNLTSTDITLLFAGNPYIANDTLNISNVLPLNGSTIASSLIDFNATINSTENFDCNFTLDGSLNETKSYTSGTDVSINFTRSLTDGSHNFSFSCNNSQTTETTDTNFITVDFGAPTINASFIDNSFYVTNNITGQFNFTDAIGLSEYRVTIDGTLIDNASISGTSFNYTLNQDITNQFPAGEHNLTILVTDGANVATVEYNILTTNYTVTFEPVIGEKETQSIELRIDKPTGIAATGAYLEYNESTYNTTALDFGSYDLYSITLTSPDITDVTSIVNLTWVYDINTTSTYANNESGSILNTQQIGSPTIDNCTNFNIPAIKFSIFDETTRAATVGNIDGYFEVWVNDPTQFSTFNLSWSGNNNYSLCLQNHTTLNINGQFIYTNPSLAYENETYYFENLPINNETQQVNLYLTGSTTQVTFTVNDENDDAVSDVLINVLAYDLTTNSYINTEILKTDSNGETFGNIILNSQWYRFSLTRGGTTLLFTDPVKITSTTRNFQVNLVEDTFVSYNKAANVTTSLTYTNSTGNFVYTFVNPTGAAFTACLDVVRRSINGDFQVNETCIVASSGSIVLNRGEVVAGNVYIAKGSVQFSKEQFTDIISIDFGNAHKVYGKDGIFAATWLKIGFAMIGSWNPIVALVLVALTDISLIILGIFKISYSMIFIYLALIILAIYKLNQR